MRGRTANPWGTALCGALLLAAGGWGQDMRFAAEEGATRQPAGPGKSGKQLAENARLQFFRPNVVEEKERARAQNSDVVYTMIHQVGADGVVTVQSKRDL